MRVAFARCAQLPEIDPDEHLLLDAARSSGLDAHSINWDDPSHDPSPFDVVVLRATWNYHREPEAFRAWLDSTSRATTLLNPLDALEWNLDKTYLDELRERDVATIPTEFVKKTHTVELHRVLETNAWEEFVIKPLISGGSFRTQRFSVSQIREASEFLDDLLLDRDAMVQRYMPSVDTHGERNIIVIDDRITHTIRKNPRFAGDDEHISEAIAPSDEEVAFANRVLDALPDSLDRRELLYARVDVMRDDDGGLVLSELELLEPSLFFKQHPPALDRFINGIVRRCQAAV
ncbi:MAG: RimK family alpha-L-glutamate ligase [Phycisphaerales bacterium JB043]